MSFADKDSLHTALSTGVPCWLPLQKVGYRSGPTKCWSWSGPKLFDTLMVFLKRIFQKKLILKKISRWQKACKDFPVCRVNSNTSIACTWGKVCWEAGLEVIKLEFILRLKAQWLVACGQISASSQSLRFILSLRETVLKFYNLEAWSSIVISTLHTL